MVAFHPNLPTAPMNGEGGGNDFRKSPSASSKDILLCMSAVKNCRPVGEDISPLPANTPFRECCAAVPVVEPSGAGTCAAEV